MTDYPDNALFGLSDKLALELLCHLRVEELSERSLYGQSSLPVPLLHLVTELIPVVKLFDLIKVGLVAGISEERQRGDRKERLNITEVIIQKPQYSTDKDVDENMNYRHNTQGPYPTYQPSFPPPPKLDFYTDTKNSTAVCSNRPCGWQVYDGQGTCKNSNTDLYITSRVCMFMICLD